MGKTEAFRRLAARTYEHFIEINFIKTPKAIGIFDGVQSASDILLRLSTFTDVPMVPGKTFILFDEIQDCKECVTQIKFLVDEGSFRYGLTGSLLGVELNDVRSEPVGYMDVADVFPLDFEEFALAIGVAPKVIDALRNSFEGRTPVDPVVHSQMMSVFHLALNNILSNAEYNIPEAIVLCNDNVRVDGKVVYLPVYMAMFLLRKRESDVGEYIPDISALTA